MYNKKAISDVVSTVLIILLVVAAVAIIGAIIINTVGNAGNNVNSAVACQQLQVVPTQCTGQGPSVGVATINAIPSGVTVKYINLLYTTATGDISNMSVGGVTSVGMTASSNKAANGGPFTKLGASATISLTDGTVVSCPASITTVNCV